MLSKYLEMLKIVISPFRKAPPSAAAAHWAIRLSRPRCPDALTLDGGRARPPIAASLAARPLPALVRRAGLVAACAPARSYGEGARGPLRAADRADRRRQDAGRLPADAGGALVFLFLRGFLFSLPPCGGGWRAAEGGEMGEGGSIVRFSHAFPLTRSLRFAQDHPLPQGERGKVDAACTRFTCRR